MPRLKFHIYPHPVTRREPQVREPNPDQLLPVPKQFRERMRGQRPGPGAGHVQVRERVLCRFQGALEDLLGRKCGGGGDGLC